MKVNGNSNWLFMHATLCAKYWVFYAGSTVNIRIEISLILTPATIFTSNHNVLGVKLFGTVLATYIRSHFVVFMHSSTCILCIVDAMFRGMGPDMLTP